MKFDEGTISNELANFIVRLQEYDSPNRGPPFIKCVKLYKATERSSSKFTQNLSGDFVNYT